MGTYVTNNKIVNECAYYAIGTYFPRVAKPVPIRLSECVPTDLRQIFLEGNMLLLYYAQVTSDIDEKNMLIIANCHECLNNNNNVFLI